MPFSSVQAFMRESRIDGWLVHDFRGSNAILGRLMPHAEGRKRWTTRRVCFYLPASGQPVLLCNPLDANQFEALPAGITLERRSYIGWKELHGHLASIIGSSGGGRIAMEYAPGCSLPVVSSVDSGTIELVRALGAEVVSSGDLIQVSIARWSDRAVKQHMIDSGKTLAIKDEAFTMIREAVAGGRRITERDVQAHMQQRFAQEKLAYIDGPIVAVNGNAANPHFDVPAQGSAEIKKGDWVLIDLWGRDEAGGEDFVFSDITWCGFVGSPGQIPARQREVFNAVRDARNASLKLAQDSWKAGRGVQGWQLDEAARAVLINAGLGGAIMHRTGHSLSPGPMVHGLGMNLDNLETHDTRQMLPGIGFTIEPGAYLPKEHFGVRNEINVYVDPAKGPVVTSGLNDEPVWCG